MYIETKLKACVDSDSIRQMVKGSYIMKLSSEGYSSGEITVGILEYKGDHYIIWWDDEGDHYGKKLKSFDQWSEDDTYPEVREEIGNFLNEMLADYDYLRYGPDEEVSLKEWIIDNWCFGEAEAYEEELEEFCNGIQLI